MWKNVAQSDYSIIGRIHFPCWIIKATFFLQRTSRCVHELKTHRYVSVKHNHIYFIQK